MSGLHEVDCSGCGRRHTLSAEQARKQRVLRCSCGQFVRMDRALTDLRSDPAPAPKAQPSEPAPAPKPVLADTDDADDEQTHMVDSLSAIAALGNKPPRAPQVSLSGTERKSQPPPRAPMRSMSPSPSRPNSDPPGDKPLWYVDLGGIETVEMTIEQLIIARRSGKLGEGALVWREGMPRWRPVGTLIPATSAASRPTPPPPPPSPPPAPPSSPPPPPPPPAPSPSATSRASDPALSSLGSYERPLATLEFALESPVSAAPRPSPRPSPPPPPAPLVAPAREQRPSQPQRAATPVPARAPTPLPARLPTPVPARLPTPVPARLPTPVPQPATWTSTSVVAPLPSPLSSSVAAMSPVTLPPSGRSAFATEQPRWLTVALAVLLCVAASGSGAFLVRTLRAHHQPLQLAATTGSAALLVSSAHPMNVPKAAVPAEPPPQVVDIASLSVEHSAPRAAPRPVAVTPPKPPAQADDSNDSDETEPAEAPAAPAPKPKTSDLPAAAHSNPYAGAAPDDGTAKKPPAPNSDAPGF